MTGGNWSTAKRPTPNLSRRTSQDEILINRMAEAAVDNAEALLSDARLLMERGSFGHAFALAVLAEEELGKATTFWLTALDKSARLTRDGKVTLGGRTYEPFASHSMKQTIRLGPPFFLGLYQPIFTLGAFSHCL